MSGLCAWGREITAMAHLHDGHAAAPVIEHLFRCFLKDFRRTYSTLFNGVRHDSGDPMEWGDKMIAHYESLRIDPRTKMLLFSDSLNFERADRLRAYFEGRIKVAFGIGTFIANDTFAPPLNIVMKTTMCNGDDVAKLSDSEGKGMCKNEDYIAFLKETIRRRMAYEEKTRNRKGNRRYCRVDSELVFGKWSFREGGDRDFGR